MTNDRERLEDAFARAEGEQEIAFRNHQRALAAEEMALSHYRFALACKHSGLARASLEHAKRADAEMVRLARKLSKVLGGARK